MFYEDLAVYSGFGGPVIEASEGDKLAEALGSKKKNLILQSHGILTAGGTVAEAAAFFIALERACQNQLLVDAAMANGQPKKIVSPEAAKYTKDTTGSPEVVYMQFVPEYDLLVKECGDDFLR